MGFFELYGVALLSVLTIVSLLWVVSVIVKDASIIDMFWGPLFVAIVWVLLPLGGQLTVKTYLVSLLVTLWGLRLAFHLASRNLGHGEDKRYQLWRSHGGPNWWLLTYPRIYLFQGAIALVVASPIIAAYVSPDTFTTFNALGVLIWLIGFIYELLADVQLVQFKANPDNQGKILDSGLWKLSRHPNYFGDALQWWGVAILALTVPTWWALIGPAVMTAVFLGISNDVLEKGMNKRHPDYEKYIANTPKFFPVRFGGSHQAS
jgi:steroid 5-alpha reductase family enzyme